ncbi:MAG: pyruvate kinase [Clostridia bacterium]|nr:pyruvate kinase [Clostridia bacterium]
MRKTKIVCTLGPASSGEAVMEEMLRSGMNVARFNFSHGTHESHKEMIERFRAVRDRLNMPAAVLLDTKGPEIRLGEIENGRAEVKTGSNFILTARSVTGNCEIGSISYAALPSQLKEGDAILIDDGRVHLKVRETTETDILCTVVSGGMIATRKGVNIPGVHLNMPYLSERDKSDLLFGIEMDVDFVAASFVRTAKDVVDMRKFLNYNGGHNIRIIAKIENEEGVDHFDEILKNCDGIMIARGDMGVEIAYERLPGLQKRFIRRCYQAGKMVITATQMLESMISNPSPTRAEITDVANAVFDGTSAVMLSGESASGKYPVEAVRAMARIAAQAERDAMALKIYANIPHDMDMSDTTNAICDAACTTARDVGAKAILTVTMTGRSARGISKFRPSETIVAATPDRKAYHQLSLSWGVHPVLALKQPTTEDLCRHAIDCARNIDAVDKGDLVVITAGAPLDVSGSTNLLRVQSV